MSSKVWTKYEENGSTYYLLRGKYVSTYDTLKGASPSEQAESLQKIYEQDDNEPAVLMGAPGVIKREAYVEGAKTDLPPGLYRFTSFLPNGDYSPKEALQVISLEQKSYVPPASIIEPIKKDVARFIESRAIYEKKQIPHKLGILLYGPPGTGKTSAIRHLVTHELPENKIVIWCQSVPSKHLLDKLRHNSKDTLKVFIFEEFFNLLSMSGDGSEHLLSFLDGEDSIGNCIVLSTTNNPERIPENIKDRVGRFDRAYLVEKLEDSEIQSFVRYYLDREPLEAEMASLRKLSPAAVKEVCIRCLTGGVGIDQAIVDLRIQHKLAKKSLNNNDRMGI